jgi:CheY-like chemotaxis protein
MKGAHPGVPSPGETASGAHEDVDGHNARSVGQVREEFGVAVAGLKQKYGSLLEQRDRWIKDLAARLTQEPPEKPRRRVLIVDDAESTVAIVSRYLEGYPVEIAHVAAAQARERLRSHEYDAILVEVACVIEPDVDGMTLCRKLCEGGDRKLVVAMSSSPGDKVKNCVAEAGAIFLRKPFQRAELVKLVQNMLPGEKR